MCVFLLLLQTSFFFLSVVERCVDFLIFSLREVSFRQSKRQNRCLKMKKNNARHINHPGYNVLKHFFTVIQSNSVERKEVLVSQLTQ